MITQDELRTLLNYNSDTGVFTWIKNKGTVAAGSVAGAKDGRGYVNIRIDKQNLRAHRLAFLYMTGAFPDAQVDHIDGVKYNNSWANLRVANNAQNQLNSGPSKRCISGYKGVIWHKLRKKWAAYAGKDKKQIYLGLYENVEDAAAAYRNYAEKNHGEFIRI